MKGYTVLEKRTGTGFNSDNRYWKVDIGGKVYHAGVEQGRRVKIAFQPRGQNWGWKWHGFVRDERGQSLVSDEVTKSTGLAFLLECAGLIPLRRSELNKIHESAKWEDHTRTQGFGPRPEICSCVLCRKDV